MKPYFVTVLITVFITAPVIAASPYRESEMPVIEPPAAHVSSDRARSIINDFRLRYEAAGKPRIALFWNVELIDNLEDKVAITKHLSSEPINPNIKYHENGLRSLGAVKPQEREYKGDFSYTLTERKDRIVTNARRHSGLNERDMWKAETTFTNTMREAGVRFIDRNMILRTTAFTENISDTRATETKALLGKADLLMEVLMTKDLDAPLGWGFRMNLRDIKTGEDRTALYTDALPNVPSPKVTFRATNTGFDKVVEQPHTSVQDIGMALATEIMTVIASTARALSIDPNK